MTLRIYLAGKLCVESGAALLREDRFPGLQGRVIFALLAAEHARPVSRDELVEEVWGDSPPASWEPALRALISKLRTLLGKAGISGDSLTGGLGAYQLQLPPEAWVDLEAAADSIHRAETARRDSNLRDAAGFGRVAAAIGARQLLLGAAGPWVERRRGQLRDVRLRALDCLAETWLASGDPATAARDAELAVDLDPFREPSHRLLMRARSESGNHAGALLAYERLRRLLADELGSGPSRETEELHLQILRSTTRGGGDP